jgi:cell division control protein 6
MRRNTRLTIAGRTVERNIIAKFTFESSLFISGTPGSGKTALVNFVLASLEHCDDLEVLTVNCMAFHNVDAVGTSLRKHWEYQIRQRR